MCAVYVYIAICELYKGDFHLLIALSCMLLHDGLSDGNTVTSTTSLMLFATSKAQVSPVEVAARCMAR